jgi:hypothetical protein
MTDFEDRIFKMRGIDDGGMIPTGADRLIDPSSFRSFDQKAADWIKANATDPALMKIRAFEPLSDDEEKRISSSLIAIDKAEAGSFFLAVSPIVFVRKTVGISQEAQDAFVSLEAGRFALTEDQRNFVSELLKFVSANGYISATVLISADDFTDFTKVFEGSSSLQAILNDISNRIKA